MDKIIKKLFDTNIIDYDELTYLLNNIQDSQLETLYAYADNIRKAYYGTKIHIRGLIEFSNYCKQNCMYCGLRKVNKNVPRYRLSEEEILKCCENAYSQGIKTFVLQSGEDDYYTDERLVSIISNIKALYKEAAITLSIGEKSKASYLKYFKAGADRYLLRHETANIDLYEQMHPGMNFTNRHSCLLNMKEIGYQIGAGFIVGLPRQNNDIIAKDLLFLKELNPHMVGIGPLIVHPQTPLKNHPGGSIEKTLICLSIIRLLLPQVLLPSTTALNSQNSNNIEHAIQAGINVIMINFTPDDVKNNYEIYKKTNCQNITATNEIKKIQSVINKTGYQMSKERGDYLNWHRKEYI